MTMKATTIAVTAILLLGGLHLYMNRYEYLRLGEIRVHNGLTVGFNVAVSVPSCLEWGRLVSYDGPQQPPNPGLLEPWIGYF